MAFEDRAQFAESSLCAVGGAFAGLACVGIGRRCKDRIEEQRRVGVAVECDIGHRQRAERLAVIPAGQRDEARALGAADVFPIVETQLQCDLDRAGAVVGVEHAAEPVRLIQQRLVGSRSPARDGGSPAPALQARWPALRGKERSWRDPHQLLGEFDGRFVGEAGQHHMVEFVELVLQRRDDARMTMPKQASPPRTYRIQIALAVVTGQPRALGARDRQHGQGFVIVHLRARVPDHGEIARGQAGRKRSVHGL